MSDRVATPAEPRLLRRVLLLRLCRMPVGIIGLVLTGTFFGVAALADRIAPTDPFAAVAAPLLPPSATHLMGTDDLGRDLLSGVVHGAQTSAIVVLTVTMLAALVGIPIGLVAGYWGGWLDDVCMRLTEFVQVVPRFFLAVVIIALAGPGLDRVVLLLGLTSWPWTARIVRAETLSLKTRDFVDAARALEASPGRILLRQILPNALPPTVGDPDRISWGYLANNAQRFLRLAWWLAAFPGAAIVRTILGLNLLGDALNDLLQPRGYP